MSKHKTTSNFPGLASDTKSQAPSSTFSERHTAALRQIKVRKWMRHTGLSSRFSGEQLDSGIFGGDRRRHSWLLRGRAPLEPLGGHSLLGREALLCRRCVYRQKAWATVCRCSPVSLAASFHKHTHTPRAHTNGTHASTVSHG